MGGQPLAGGKPLVVGKHFTGVKPTWLQHQQTWGKDALTSPSIPTIGFYPRQPFLGVYNPLWGQTDLARIPPEVNFPYQSVNPMIPMKKSLQSPYMGGESG